jgi:hypothetical protein
MLSDPYAEWSKSLGLSLDLTGMGLGIRTARYAMIIDDLVIKYVEVSNIPFLISRFLTHQWENRLSRVGKSPSPELTRYLPSYKQGADGSVWASVRL